MAYFVTGATGFIGRNLVEQLLARGKPIYVLVREGSHEEARRSSATALGRGREAVIAIAGDLSQPSLGVSDGDLRKLKGKIDHFFHLAAIYDMTRRPKTQQVANVDGTRHAVRSPRRSTPAASTTSARSPPPASTTATFREDMFEEAEELDHPYFRTKHESEAHRARGVQAAVARLPAGHRRRPLARPARSTRSTGPTTSSS